MTDLEKLVPQALEQSINGETLAIKPLKVGQMPAFLRAISPVMQHLTKTEIDWLALFGQQGDDLLSAIAIAVGKPRQLVDELAADQAIVLAAKVIEVNADFFYPNGDAQTRRTARSGQESRTTSASGDTGFWFDAIQRLIVNGHHLPDILDYTLAQLHGFLHAINRQDGAIDARFKAQIAQLMRGGNAYFIKNAKGNIVLMAENIKEHAQPLAGFKRRYRKAEGIKRIKQGADIPIAVLVPRVVIKRRLNVEKLVEARIPQLAMAVENALGTLD